MLAVLVFVAVLAWLLARGIARALDPDAAPPTSRENRSPPRTPQNERGEQDAR